MVLIKPSFSFIAELMDNNPRVQGLMDLIRFKLNQLVIDMMVKMLDPNVGEHTLEIKTQNLIQSTAA